MKECDNSTRKIHISSNFILSISLLIMFDTLLLRPPLHCNTPPHFTQLHFTTLHHTSPNYTSLHLWILHFLSFTLHYPFIYLYAFTFPIVLFHFTFSLFRDVTRSTLVVSNRRFGTTYQSRLQGANLHTKRSSIQSDIYQMSYWYN
jgi:hypothetical protein